MAGKWEIGGWPVAGTHVMNSGGACIGVAESFHSGER